MQFTHLLKFTASDLINPNQPHAVIWDDKAFTLATLDPNTMADPNHVSFYKMWKPALADQIDPRLTKLELLEEPLMGTTAISYVEELQATANALGLSVWKSEAERELETAIYQAIDPKVFEWFSFAGKPFNKEEQALLAEVYGTTVKEIEKAEALKLPIAISAFSRKAQNLIKRLLHRGRRHWLAEHVKIDRTRQVLLQAVGTPKKDERGRVVRVHPDVNSRGFFNSLVSEVRETKLVIMEPRPPRFVELTHDERIISLGRRFASKQESSTACFYKGKESLNNNVAIHMAAEGVERLTASERRVIEKNFLDQAGVDTHRQSDEDTTLIHWIFKLDNKGKLAFHHDRKMNPDTFIQKGLFAYLTAAGLITMDVL